MAKTKKKIAEDKPSSGSARKAPGTKTAKPKGAPKREESAEHAAHLSAGVLSSEVRERMIRESAYLRAERRGFEGGTPEQDWFEAEQEVDRTLSWKS